MIKKKTNTTEQEKQGTIYSENIQIPISKGENNNALIIESNDSEIQQKYIEPNLSQADNSYVVVGIPEISASKIQYEMEENGRHIQILDLSRYVGIATVQYNPLKHNLPYNLMRAVSPANWNGYWKYDSYDIPMTVEVSVNGRVIYIPKFIAESNIGLCECALNSGIPEMYENLYQYGRGGKTSYDTAFATYSYLYAFNRKPSCELTTYIRRVGKKIMEYMIESNRTQDAIRLISFNILTPNALKALHESAIQRNRVEIAAYLMEAIRKNGKNTSMRL